MESRPAPPGWPPAPPPLRLYPQLEPTPPPAGHAHCGFPGDELQQRGHVGSGSGDTHAQYRQHIALSNESRASLTSPRHYETTNTMTSQHKSVSSSPCEADCDQSQPATDQAPPYMLSSQFLTMTPALNLPKPTQHEEYVRDVTLQETSPPGELRGLSVDTRELCGGVTEAPPPSFSQRAPLYESTTPPHTLQHCANSRRSLEENYMTLNLPPTHPGSQVTPPVSYSAHPPSPGGPSHHYSNSSGNHPPSPGGSTHHYSNSAVNHPSSPLGPAHHYTAQNSYNAYARGSPSNVSYFPSMNVNVSMSMNVHGLLTPGPSHHTASAYYTEADAPLDPWTPRFHSGGYPSSQSYHTQYPAAPVGLYGSHAHLYSSGPVMPQPSPPSPLSGNCFLGPSGGSVGGAGVRDGLGPAYTPSYTALHPYSGHSPAGFHPGGLYDSDSAGRYMSGGGAGSGDGTAGLGPFSRDYLKSAVSAGESVSRLYSLGAPAAVFDPRSPRLYPHCADARLGFPYDSVDSATLQLTAGKLNLCRICGKTYARPSTLKTHMRTHSGEKPYKCGTCSKSFSQAANLTAHVRTHSGEKPFRCPLCDRKFSQSSSVTTHMRTHSGERPYRCRLCKKAFSDSSTLTKHLRIHSGEKPYQCKLCLLRFSQSGNLNRHMRIHAANLL